MKKLLLILSTITIVSCCPVKQKQSDIQSDAKMRNTERVKILSVAPYRVMGMGVGPRPCYLVKDGEEGAWQLFYTTINGFHFEPGWCYRLEVKESRIDQAPADGSSLHYDLMEVLEKKREVQPLKSLQGYWKVIRLNGTQAVPENVEQTIDMDTTAMTVAGHGGTNRYRARLAGSGGASKIGFEQMISTRRYGPYQQQEDAFFKALKEVDGYYRYGSSLLLLVGDRVVVEARLIE